MLSTPGTLAPEGSEHLPGSRAASSVSGMLIPAAVPGGCSPVTLGTEKLLVWLWEASNEKCVGRTVLRVGWFAMPFTGQEQEL